MRRRSIEDGDDGSEVEGGWLCSTMLVLDAESLCFTSIHF